MPVSSTVRAGTRRGGGGRCTTCMSHGSFQLFKGRAGGAHLMIEHADGTPRGPHRLYVAPRSTSSVGP